MKLYYTSNLKEPLDIADNQPPLLFLHGLLGSSVNWHTIAKAYRTDYRIIIPDLRNHGRSPHDPQHRYDLMVEDLIELLDRLNIASCIPIGHSMGGKAAMFFALKYPQRVKKLVVVDIAPVTYQHDFSDIYDAMVNLDLNKIKNRADADQALAKTLKNSAIRQFILQNLQLKQKKWQWRIDLTILKNATDDIAGFEIENSLNKLDTLFIRGANSPYVKETYYPKVKQYFPNAQIKTIKGAGHWVYYEQQVAFQTQLNAYLSHN